MSVRPLALCLALATLPGAAVSVALPQAVSAGTGGASAEEEIRVALTDFVEGWRDADVARLRRATAAEGMVFWSAAEARPPVVTATTFAELWVDRTPRPGYGEPWQVLELDVVDDALAWAKLDIADRAGPVIDELLLYRIGDRWQVVANAFHVDPGREYGVTPAPASAASRESIEVALEAYVRGWREGDAAILAAGFDFEHGSIFWVGDDDGVPTAQSMTFGAASARGKKSPGYGEPWEVLDLDIVGDDVAVAKLFIARRGGSYIDYLLLCRVGDDWRIVGKAFASRRADPSPGPRSRS